MSVTLSKENAKACLNISKKAFNAGSKVMLLGERPDQEEHRVDKFIEEFSTFIEYLEMMVATDVTEVSIPPHHEKIYFSIKAAAVLLDIAINERS